MMSQTLLDRRCHLMDYVVLQIRQVLSHQLLNRLQRTVLPCVVGYAVCLKPILIKIRMRQEEIYNGKNTFCFG